MRTQVAAIEFGTSKIVTVIAQNGSFNRCDIIGSGTVPYDGFSYGAWVTPERLAQAVYNSISAAERDANTKIKDIYIGIPSEFIHVRTAEATVTVSSDRGRVAEEDIDLVQDMAADMFRFKEHGGNVIHRSPAWFIISDGDKTMQPLNMEGERLTSLVSFITAEQVFIDDMRELMDSMGITINGFLSTSFGQQLLLTTPADREKPVIFIDVGFLNTEFSIIEGDGILYHTNIPMGGAHFTENLSQALAISGSEAEKLKRCFMITDGEFEIVNPPVFRDEYGRRVTYDEELVIECMKASLDELCGMIDRTLVEEADKLVLARTPVFLTGNGLAMIRGGKEYLSSYLGRSVKVPQAKSANLNLPGYSSILGLVDLVFDAIDQRTPEQETLPGRLADSFRGLFGRR